MFQSFDTQIHIIDDLTNRMNIDNWNSKESIEYLKTQEELDLKVVTTELRQSEGKVYTRMSIVEKLIPKMSQNSTEQKNHYALTKLWPKKNEKTITHLQQPVKTKEDSFALSSPDMKEVSPHMSSEPKSEDGIAPHIDQTLHPLQRIDQLLDEEIQLKH